MPLTVLGGGSNILVSDAGIRGLVLLNQARHIQAVTTGELPLGEPPQLVVETGAPLAGLARWAIRAGWAGLEWAVSVPGTLGGAIAGNAGAHGSEIACSLAWVEVLFAGGERRILAPAELKFGYRSSCFKDAARSGDEAAPVLLRAGIAVAPGDAAEMGARADAYLARRRSTQPVEPSAGSIFRNPMGGYAGQMIEAAGLKGERRGGAQISPRHANFIVNVEQATAADVVSLIRLARERVHAREGLWLEPEILFVGEWPELPPYTMTRNEN